MNQKLKILQLSLIILGTFFFCLQSQAQSNCHIDDWRALKALYEDTDGDNWTRNTNWANTISGISPPNKCNLNSLHGITTENGRVVKIVLSGNNVTGILPASDLRKLTHLYYLHMPNNGLTDRFPDLGSMPNLTHIHLNENNLTGRLETWRLSGLTNLTNLRVDRNSLNNNLPQLTNLTKLERLYLSHNNFTGNIPASYANLSDLKTLTALNNSLSGDLPYQLRDLCYQLWPGTPNPLIYGDGRITTNNNFTQTWTDFCTVLPRLGGLKESDFLAQNSPNPFSNSTTIQYSLPENSVHAKLSIKDIAGKAVKTIEIEQAGAGIVNLSTKDLPMGIYTYTLYSNGEAIASKKMIVAKQ